MRGFRVKMPVFISYSHEDRKFVDQLATQLVRHRVHLWLDRWELRVGDSLTSCIENAIGGASALLVVLSKAATSSEWFRRELNAGLVRELEERRVIVLPVLKEDCEIPLFLRDKLYADFRSNADTGLKAVLESLARLINDSLGRVIEPEWHMDWAIDWGTVRIGRKAVAARTRVTIVEQADAQPFSVLSVIEIADATRKTIDNALAQETFKVLVESVTDDPRWSVLLEDQFEKIMQTEIVRNTDGATLYVTISARRLGEDTGRDILFHAGRQIQQIGRQISDLPILRA